MFGKGDEQINFQEIVEKSYLEMGNVNIVIAGKTGVGKSTLVNAVFGENLAKTGKGQPVSQTTKEYKSDNMRGLTLFDTKGFELGKYREILSDLKNFISSRKTVNPNDHIHVCWYCINDFGNRYEKEEINFIQELQSEIPVIVVFTQAISNDEFYKKCCQDHYSVIHNSVRVLAERYVMGNGLAMEPYGTVDLVKKTKELLPECAVQTFVSVQKVDKTLKRNQVSTIIKVAAAGAIAAGASPIPFSDAFVLAPIQIIMMAKISSTMGLNLNSGFLSTLVGSTAGVTGATAGGRVIVSTLLKMMPGAGSVIGGAISAAIAGTLTTTMGWAYYKAIDAIFTKGIKPENVSPEDLANIFKDNLRKGDNNESE